MRRFFSLLAVCAFALTSLIARPAPADAGIACPPGCALAGIISGLGLVPSDLSTFYFSGNVVIAGSGPGAAAVTAGVYGIAISASINVGANETVTGSGWAYVHDPSFYESYFGNVTLGGTLAAMTISAADVNKFTGVMVRAGLAAPSSQYAGLVTVTR